MVTITLSLDELEILRSLLGDEQCDQTEFNHFYDLLSHYIQIGTMQEQKAWNI